LDPDYEIFDLLVERHASGYRARVLSSPAGNESADLDPTITEDQLQSFLFRVGRPRRLTRRVGPSVTEETKKFGNELLRFLFPDRIWACFERSRFAANSRDRGLRIQIRLSDVPELCDLPWEFLYHDDAGFLALSAQTPVARYLDIRQPSVPLSLQHPLRILVLISGPRDLPRLDVDREWTKLRDAVADIEAKGLVSIERLDTPRLSRLNRRLRTEQFHILHFIGHGDFDDNKGSGELFFEDDQGRSSPVSAAQVATALRDHQSVRLVILNACEGARSSRTDPFAGTAQTLIRAGVPAVIAMQFEVTDDAAITFSSELYTSIALGDSVDRALSEARKAIYLDGNELEWATPVLYLRSPDSRIFALPQTAAIEEERTRHGAARSTARTAQWTSPSSRQSEDAEEAERQGTDEERQEAKPARLPDETRQAEAAERPQPKEQHPQHSLLQRLVGRRRLVLAGCLVLLGITASVVVATRYRARDNPGPTQQSTADATAQRPAQQKAAADDAAQRPPQPGSADQATEQPAQQTAAADAAQKKDQQKAADDAAQRQAQQKTADEAAQKPVRQEAADETPSGQAPANATDETVQKQTQQNPADVAQGPVQQKGDAGPPPASPQPPVDIVDPEQIAEAQRRLTSI
jgi:hypothetical protein